MINVCRVSSFSLCKSPQISCLCCQIWLEDNPLSSYLHIKPNLTLTLVNGGCYGYTPFLVELHNLLSISRYHEWQEKLASKRQAGRGGASYPVRHLVFHPGLRNIAHICMARWCRWERGVWLLRFIITVCSVGTLATAIDDGQICAGICMTFSKPFAVPYRRAICLPKHFIPPGRFFSWNVWDNGRRLNTQYIIKTIEWRGVVQSNCPEERGEIFKPLSLSIPLFCQWSMRHMFERIEEAVEGEGGASEESEKRGTEENGSEETLSGNHEDNL